MNGRSVLSRGELPRPFWHVKARPEDRESEGSLISDFLASSLRNECLFTSSQMYRISFQQPEWTKTRPYSFSVSCHSTGPLRTVLGKDLDSFRAVAPGVGVGGSLPRGQLSFFAQILQQLSGPRAFNFQKRKTGLKCSFYALKNHVP